MLQAPWRIQRQQFTRKRHSRMHGNWWMEISGRAQLLMNYFTNGLATMLLQKAGATLHLMNLLRIIARHYGKNINMVRMRGMQKITRECRAIYKAEAKRRIS